MGKVRDEAPAKSSKPAPKAGGNGKGGFVSYLRNLFRTDPYKPLQGWNARLWSGVGMGTILALGIWQLFQSLRQTRIFRAPAQPGGFDPNLIATYGIPAALIAVLGWAIYRLLHFPPFADFLIATEAEMKKVSWITRDDLKRATAVVLATVVLLSTFLFGVDWIWMQLLQFIGVLQVASEGFGSTA
ncbi:preprotein translocase subunit SecE [soil metagenome]